MADGLIFSKCHSWWFNLTTKWTSNTPCVSRKCGKWQMKNKNVVLSLICSVTSLLSWCSMSLVHTLLLEMFCQWPANLTWNLVPFTLMQVSCFLSSSCWHAVHPFLYGSCQAGLSSGWMRVSCLVWYGSVIRQDVSFLSGWNGDLLSGGMLVSSSCWLRTCCQVGCGSVISLDSVLLSGWLQVCDWVWCKFFIWLDAGMLSGWMLVFHQVGCRPLSSRLRVFVRFDASLLSGLIQVSYPFGNWFGIRLDVSWEIKEMEKIHNSCQSVHSSLHTIWNGFLCTSFEKENLRSSKYIQSHVPSTKTEFGKTAFTYSAPVSWNEIQKSLKLTDLISLTEFKSYLNQTSQIVCSCFELFFNFWICLMSL